MEERMVQASDSESKFPVVEIISHKMNAYITKKGGATEDEKISLGGLLFEINSADLEEIKSKSSEIRKLATEAVAAYVAHLEDLLERSIKIMDNIGALKKAIEESPRIVLKVLQKKISQ